MEKINRGNYESWMLDYAEGSLSAKDRAALEAFLAVNTDLRSELDEYEAIIVPKPAHNSPGWEALKQPNLAALNMDISAREQLYFRAVEGQINAAERSLLDDLLRKPAFAAEHQLWMKSRLVPGAENVDHEQLYQFGLDLPVSESNFEYHLIALTEGLLSEAQCRALTEFAERQPSKQRELALAEKLRLAPAAGIFYPDKDKLYQLKEKAIPLLWAYRAAAVVVLLGLAAVLWNSLGTSGSGTQVPLAEEGTPKTTQQATPAAAGDTVATPVKADSTQSPAVDDAPALEMPLRSWEVLEPEEINVAENLEQPQLKPLKQKTFDENPKAVENQTPQNQTPVLPIPSIAPEGRGEDYAQAVTPLTPSGAGMESIPAETPKDEVALNAQEAGAASKAEESAYLTLPELATNTLARKFDMDEKERDNLALAIAKRLTDKAGEALNTEVKKEVDSDNDHLTYTVRIGNFKVSHSRNK